MLTITRHARQAWQDRAKRLNLDPSDRALLAAVSSAVREKTKSRSARWHLFMRQMTKGETHYIVRDGWRFVVSDNKIVTCERVRPEENHITVHLN